MKKDPAPYLEDIRNSIARIEKYLDEINNNKQVFEEDIEKQDAVIRRLEIIGETTKRLTDEFKNQFPGIPWRKMAGMRDVLIHNYDEIDLELVWKVVMEDIPVLKTSIDQVVPEK